MPNHAWQVVCNNPDKFLWLVDRCRWMESPPADDYPLSASVYDLVYDVGRLLDALDFVQADMATGIGLLSERSMPFYYLMGWLDRLRRTVHILRDDLRGVHGASGGVPEVAGKAVTSYIESAVGASNDRVNWMLQFIPRSTAESINERTAADAKEIIERIDSIRELWKFDLLDIDDLWCRVLWEAEQLKSFGKKAATAKGCVPTKAEINAIRGVLESLLPTKNPTREAIRTAMAGKGLKLGNDKLAKTLAILNKK